MHASRLLLPLDLDLLALTVDPVSLWGHHQFSYSVRKAETPGVTLLDEAMRKYSASFKPANRPGIPANSLEKKTRPVSLFVVPWTEVLGAYRR